MTGPHFSGLVPLLIGTWLLFFYSLECIVCVQFIGCPREDARDSSLLLPCSPCSEMSGLQICPFVRQRISFWCLYFFLPTYILISNLARIHNLCKSKTFDLYLDHDQTWLLRWKQLSLLFLPAPWICRTGHKPSSEKWIIDFRVQDNSVSQLCRGRKNPSEESLSLERATVHIPTPSSVPSFEFHFLGRVLRLL